MYAKVFRSLWEGSMRGRSDEQLVFVYMLCHADSNGICDIIHDKIAADTGLLLEEVRTAVTLLESEDSSSRSPDANGRRIVRLDEHRNWGWLIVNYPKYRTMSDIEKVREQNRLRAQKHRDKLRENVTQSNVTQRDVTRVTESNAKQKQKKKDSTTTKVNPTSVPSISASVNPPSSTEPEEITAEDAFHLVFWPEYPRKTAKIAALKAWKSLKIKDDQPERVRAIMDGLEHDKRHEWTGRDTDKIPHAATWLNQHRWEDHQ